MVDAPRLYFEAHITVTPPDKDPHVVDMIWDQFITDAMEQGWRASRFDVDEVDHYDGAWFLSTRGQDYDAILEDIRKQKKLLVDAGYLFVRAKIEDTLFDTKHGDSL